LFLANKRGAIDDYEFLGLSFANMAYFAVTAYWRSGVASGFAQYGMEKAIQGYMRKEGTHI
jgi:hypothetical protein